MSLLAYQARGDRAALPTIQVPGDERLLSEFASELAALLLSRPTSHPVDLFRRDRTVVVPMEEGKSLMPIQPTAFVTWIETHVTPYRLRTSPIDGDTDNVPTSITLWMATQTLASFHFWTRLPVIDRCYPVPSLIRRPDNTIEFLKAGYDTATKSYVFQF